MAYKTLAPGISVTTQISPDDVEAAAAAGYRTIINNRPDFEEPNQPTSASLARRAQAAGLDYLYLPVVPRQIDDGSIEAFGVALGARPGPILAFCKTGTRSASLWAFAQAGTLTPAEILRHAATAGYDLTSLAPRLVQRASRRADA